MENLHYEGTTATPEIIFDEEKNILLIKGQSYPENAFEFYDPIIDWINEYLKNLETEATLQLHLKYLNTSSSKSIMDIIEIFNNAYNDGKNVKIEWYYHPKNRGLEECGEDFKEDQDIPFEIIETSIV